MRIMVVEDTLTIFLTVTVSPDPPLHHYDYDLVFISTMSYPEIFPGKIQKLEGEIKSKENSLEEKEMVVAHLVNVVNRYAFNDR